MQDSIFTKIIKRELPAEIVFENEHLIAIQDIYPKAPIHLLIIPKKQIPDLQSLSKEDAFLVAEVALAAQHLAKKYGVEKGYRLLTNNGESAGQSVFHLHFHLLGGRILGVMG